ncbi:CYSTEINE-RICH SECRETORY PROTEIN-RELATED [Salix viminalis]|uniref:CYSTEINE-RICH SECRETORY PROTEIN-RELATED n=1 Tax=Salix viminalis TaxID=40686 RepID=A0A9Q0NI25_SALVM|nr:CYSTEINE-RICH SECRETORY PROTEIN-RELATED [Salix viminalis]
MEISKNSLAIAFLVALATTIPLSLAQNSQQDYLNAHNNARAQVGVGNMVWDNNVAAYANNYVQRLKGDCRLVHSGGPYGENLAGSTGDLSGSAAVKMWVDEKPKYDYNSNSCVGGECRHYTQVVWRKSVRLGCAKARCNNGGTIISCNYDPRGNYVNERPY